MDYFWIFLIVLLKISSVTSGTSISEINKRRILSQSQLYSKYNYTIKCHVLDNVLYFKQTRLDEKIGLKSNVKNITSKVCLVLDNLLDFKYSLIDENNRSKLHIKSNYLKQTIQISKKYRYYNVCFVLDKVLYLNHSRIDEKNIPKLNVQTHIYLNKTIRSQKYKSSNLCLVLDKVLYSKYSRKDQQFEPKLNIKTNFYLNQTIHSKKYKYSKICLAFDKMLYYKHCRKDQILEQKLIIKTSFHLNQTTHSDKYKHLNVCLFLDKVLYSKHSRIDETIRPKLFTNSSIYLTKANLSSIYKYPNRCLLFDDILYYKYFCVADEINLESNKIKMNSKKIDFTLVYFLLLINKKCSLRYVNLCHIYDKFDEIYNKVIDVRSLNNELLKHNISSLQNIYLKNRTLDTVNESAVPILKADICLNKSNKNLSAKLVNQKQINIKVETLEKQIRFLYQQRPFTNFYNNCLEILYNYKTEYNINNIQDRTLQRFQTRINEQQIHINYLESVVKKQNLVNSQIYSKFIKTNQKLNAIIKIENNNNLLINSLAKRLSDMELNFIRTFRDLNLLRNKMNLKADIVLFSPNQREKSASKEQPESENEIEYYNFGQNSMFDQDEMLGTQGTDGLKVNDSFVEIMTLDKAAIEPHMINITSSGDHIAAKHVISQNEPNKVLTPDLKSSLSLNSVFNNTTNTSSSADINVFPETNTNQTLKLLNTSLTLPDDIFSSSNSNDSNAFLSTETTIDPTIKVNSEGLLIENKDDNSNNNTVNQNNTGNSSMIYDSIHSLNNKSLNNTIFNTNELTNQSSNIDKIIDKKDEIREEIKDKTYISELEISENAKSNSTVTEAKQDIEKSSSKIDVQNNQNLKSSLLSTSLDSASKSAEFLVPDENLLLIKNINMLTTESTSFVNTTEFPQPPLYFVPDYKKAKDCYDHYKQGRRHNMPLSIQPMAADRTVDVFCDMKQKGWTVIQRRVDGKQDFNRTWKEYKIGFGSIYGDHWLGNELIHLLTNQDEYSLRIELSTFNHSTHVVTYNRFRLADENDAFRLFVADYRADAANGGKVAGDSMLVHHGQRFSTHDADNDGATSAFGGNCARRFGGGWWFDKCYRCNLNGRYYKGGEVDKDRHDGIAWKTLIGTRQSLKKVEMKIRPRTAGE